MHILHIEHPVRDFELWKEAFDSDPLNRERSGVRRYRISRGIDDRNFVTLDLEFETESEATGLLTAMRAIWDRMEGPILLDPKARVVEVVEAHTYWASSQRAT